TVKIYGGYCNHHHDGREGDHRNPLHHVAEHRDEREQKHTRNEGGNACASSAELHIHDGLTDHCATCNTAPEPCEQVCDAECPRLTVVVRLGGGEVVNELRGEQSFKQPDERNAECRRQNEAKCFECEGCQ